MKKEARLIFAFSLMVTLLTTVSYQCAKASDAYFYDDFKVGNSDGWTKNLGSWQVVGGSYSVSVGVVENGITTVTNMPLTDCVIETKLRFTDAVGFRAGIVFRYTDNQHYYSFELSREYNTLGVFKYNPQDPGYGTDLTGLGSGTYPVQRDVDYTLRVVVQGNIFRCFVNGQEVMSGTDDSYGSGLVGLRARRADVSFDYFKVENGTNLPLPSPTANPTPKPDLMAWWKLNEGAGTAAIDSSGNNRNGVIQSATWTNDQTRSSLNFNGNSSYVSVPALPLTTADSLTVAAWINSDLTKVGYIFYQGNLGEFELTNGEATFDRQGTEQYPNLAGFSVKLSDSSWYDAYSSVPIQPNTWHQFVGVWVKGISVKIYVDGALAGENDRIASYGLYNPGSSFPPSLGIYGQDRWQNPGFFKGQMRNVMIYNKALSAQEIQTLYNIFEEPIANFTCSPAPGTVGSPLFFNASLSQPNIGGTQANSITSYQWDFGDGNTSSTNQATIFHIYAAQNLYNVTLTVFDSSGKNASSSQIVKVMMPTTVTISTASSTVLGSAVSITGNLTDANKNGLSNQTVVLYYTFAGLNSWLPISSATTDSDGTYNIQWENTATGTFTLKAEWQGNDTFVCANNTVSLSSLPYRNPYVFLVESNSTVTSLAFNSTSLELSFTVGGDSGTTGYVKATIAKTLIGNPENIKVSIDGNQLKYSLGSDDEVWQLNFNYHHSTHQVRIEMPSGAAVPSASFSPSSLMVVDHFPDYPLLFIIGIVIAVVATALGTTAYLKRRNAKHE